MNNVPSPRDQARCFLGSLAVLVALLVALSCFGARSSSGQTCGSGSGGSGSATGGSGPSSSYACGCYQYTGPTVNYGGDPVELWRGELQWSQTDLVVGGPVPMRVSRHHHAIDFSTGPFGPGTSMDYDYFIAQTTHSYPGYDLVCPQNRHALFQVRGSTSRTDSTDPEFAGCTLTFANTTTLQATLAFPDGTLYNFNTTGALVTIRDRLNNGLNFSRNASGYLTSISNTANSSAINPSYGTSGVVSSISDTPLNRTVSFSYGTDGCVSQVVDAAGGTTLYCWGVTHYGIYTGHGLLSVIDPRGIQILATSYDSSGRVTAQQMGNGGWYQFSYILPGDGTRITQVTDPNGNVTSYHLKLVSAYAYHPLDITSALGRTTTFGYAASGPPFLTSVTDFRNRSVSFGWNSSGDLLTVNRSTVNGGLATTSFAYDPTYHQLTSVTDELGKTTAISLNTQALPQSITATYGPVVQYLYNAAGQVTQATDPASGQWSTVYNASGFPASSTNPASETTTASFDGAGRLTGLTDALSRSVTLGVTPLSRLASVTGPSSSGYALTRNAASMVTALSPNSGGQHSWTFDNAGETASGTDPVNATETVLRDGNSNPTQITDRKGQKTVISYTTGDRVSQVVYKRADGTTESTVTYSYDPSTDLLASISDSAGPGYSFQYNFLDEVTAIVGPEGTTVRGFDNLGRLTSEQVPGQSAVTYGYDAYGRLSTVSKGSQTLTCSYDSTTGRLASVTRPNGIVTKYFYDSVWRVNQIQQWYGASQLEYETYTFDAGHRITGRTRNGVNSTFGYSTLDDLTSSTIPNQTATLVYSAAGNRTSQTINSTPKTLAYNVANRLTSNGGASVVHDANGSITQDGTTTYQWDVRGRLT